MLAAAACGEAGGGSGAEITESKDPLTGNTIVSGTVTQQSEGGVLTGEMVLSCTLPAKTLALTITSYGPSTDGQTLPAAPLQEVDQRWGSAGDIETMWNPFDGMGMATTPFNNQLRIDVSSVLEKAVRSAVEADAIAANLERAIVSDSLFADSLAQVRLALDSLDAGPDRDFQVSRWDELTARKDEIDSTITSALIQSSQIPPVAISIPAGEDRTSMLRSSLQELREKIEWSKKNFGPLSSSIDPITLASRLTPDWVASYKAEGGAHTVVMDMKSVEPVLDRCRR